MKKSLSGKGNRSVHAVVTATGILTAGFLLGIVPGNGTESFAMVQAHAEEQKPVLSQYKLGNAVADAYKKDNNVTKIAISKSAAGKTTVTIDTGIVGYVQGDTFYIAPEVEGNKIYAPVNFSSMFDTEYYGSNGSIPVYQYITSIDLSGLNLSQTKTIGKFGSSLSNIEWNLSGWDLSNVTRLDGVFWGLDMSKVDLSGWNTSNVTNMSNLFYETKNLTQEIVDCIDTTNCQNMRFLFYESELDEIDLSGWDTSNVTDMSYMFGYTKSLKEVTLGGEFDTSKVKDFSYMFDNSTLSKAPVQQMDFSSASNVTGMFQYCRNITELDFSGKTFGSELTSISSISSDCGSMKTFLFQNVTAENLSSINGLFMRCDSLETIDFSGTDMSKITNFGSLFYGCQQSSFDLSFMDFSNAENINGMFSCCTNLVSVEWGDTKFDKVTKASSLFSSCNSLQEADISVLAGNPIEEVNNMFSSCTNLAEVDLSPLSGAPITQCYGMFSSCTSLAKVDLKPLANAPITDMRSMFNGCKEMNAINVSVLQKACPSSLSNLCSYCTKLERIEIGQLDVSKVEDTINMFEGCTSLSDIDFSGIQFKKLSQLNSMFYECTGLKQVRFGQNLMKWSNFNAMFFGCSNLEYIDLGGAIDVSKSVAYSSGGNYIFSDCDNLKELCCQKSFWDSMKANTDSGLNAELTSHHHDADGDDVCDECGYLFNTKETAKYMALSLSDYVRFHLLADFSVNQKLVDNEANYFYVTFPDGSVAESSYDQATVNTEVEEGVTLYDHSFGIPAAFCGGRTLYLQVRTADGCFGEFIGINTAEEYLNPISGDTTGKYSKNCKAMVNALYNYASSAYDYFYEERDREESASLLTYWITSYRNANPANLNTRYEDEHYAGMTLLLDYDLILRVYRDEDFKGSVGSRDGLYFAQYRVAPYQFDVVNPISGQSVNDYLTQVYSQSTNNITVGQYYYMYMCIQLHKYGVAAKAYYEEEMSK